MQLTNSAFMSSRNHYLDAQRDLSNSSSRISSSTKLNYSPDDTAAISQAASLKSNILLEKSYIKNLQSTRSYLKFQEDGYRRVFQIYQRMEEISRETLIQAKSTNNPYSKEFEQLKKDLVQIKNTKLNGVAIYDPVATCGDIDDIDASQTPLNYTSATKERDVAQTIRGMSIDVGAYGGDLSFNVNSGGTGEYYRVFMGNTEIFSTGPSFGGDPSELIINRYRSSATRTEHEDTQGLLNPQLWQNNQDSWRTSGSADNGDPDTFNISFGPGQETTYSINIGSSNQNIAANGAVPQGNLLADGGVIRIADLDEKASSTQLTVHVETSSIGKVSDIKFSPKYFDTQIDIDGSGNQVSLKAVGIETFEDFSIDSSESAQKTSDKLLGNGAMMGEIECIGGNWLPKIASAINRIDSEISAAEKSSIESKIALGRITDSDIASETTSQAKKMLKMDMAAFVMSNTTRINDILTPLTTNHHRSAIMNGSALL